MKIRCAKCGHEIRIHTNPDVCVVTVKQKIGGKIR